MLASAFAVKLVNPDLLQLSAMLSQPLCLQCICGHLLLFTLGCSRQILSLLFGQWLVLSRFGRSSYVMFSDG